MKSISIKYTSLFFLLIASFVSSCTKELNQEPIDKFDASTFWTSEDNAFLALMGVYRGNIFANASEFNPTDWWTYTGLNWMELATDNAYARTGESAPFNKLTNGTLTSNITILGFYWSNSYSKIAKCNDFLEHIGSVSMDETRKKRMIAEVRFLRACQYFYLSQFFGSVPLVTKVLTLQEANTVEKATHPQLVDFVLKELTESIPDLPRFKDIPLNQTGRASRQAALAFLGRLHLAEGNFNEAAATYKTIIDFGDNIIDPDYQSIFLESNENSPENIFSTQFVPNLLANPIMQHFAPSMGGGFNLMNPLVNLVEAYGFNDGTPFSYTDPRYDPKDLGKNRDPRLKYTVLYNNAPYGSSLYISNPDSINAKDRLGSANLTLTGFGVRKYMNEALNTSLTTTNGGNLPIIRYAEILLSYLEAKLESGAAIDQALLDATINRVRTRPSVNMPKITETDPVLLRPILRNERRVELALEGIRLWDLLRWKIADQVLKGDFYGHPFPGVKAAIRKKNAAAPADPYFRWYVTTKNFRKGVDEYWPVPQSEVNINPKLQ
jgi:hypothetical protein